MKWLKQHWRAIARVVGVFLVLTSVYIAFWWFYRLGPTKNILDPNWHRQHSTEAYWNEAQASLRRIGWSHDDGFRAGRYGDADFMAWAMSHTRPEDSGLNDCGAGHRASGFCKITNHDLGDEGKGWLEWWEKNKSKSQIEWIQDGFAKYDVAVSVPSSDSDTIHLLQLLGNTATHIGKHGREVPVIPDFIQYNAFRWLHASDFNPIEFALSNDTKTLDPIVKAGLLKYLQYERCWQDDFGRLYFDGKPDPDEDSWDLPLMLIPKFRIKVYAKIIVPLFFGLSLIFWTYRKPQVDKTNA